MRIETTDKNTNKSRHFVRFGYNGTPYFGFQIQPKQISVEETMENAFSKILRRKIKLVGAGRTDTGVHAKMMYAHFDFDGPLPFDFVKRLNSLLGWSIVVYEIFRVKEDAHARFDAITRTYEYRISLFKDPFSKDLSWQLRKTLDVQAMNEACKILMRYDDFTSFAKLHTDNKTNLCKISKAIWKTGDEQLIFTITSDRFLRNMVRSIVGTMVDIGSGKIPPAELNLILKEKDRARGGSSAPACGLYLLEVTYDFEQIKY